MEKTLFVIIVCLVIFCFLLLFIIYKQGETIDFIKLKFDEIIELKDKKL